MGTLSPKPLTPEEIIRLISNGSGPVGPTIPLTPQLNQAANVIAPISAPGGANAAVSVAGDPVRRPAGRMPVTGPPGAIAGIPRPVLGAISPVPVASIVQQPQTTPTSLQALIANPGLVQTGATEFVDPIGAGVSTDFAQPFAQSVYAPQEGAPGFSAAVSGLQGEGTKARAESAFSSPTLIKGLGALAAAIGGEGSAGAILGQFGSSQIEAIGQQRLLANLQAGVPLEEAMRSVYTQGLSQEGIKQSIATDLATREAGIDERLKKAQTAETLSRGETLRAGVRQDDQRIALDTRRVAALESDTEFRQALDTSKLEIERTSSSVANKLTEAMTTLREAETTQTRRQTSLAGYTAESDRIRANASAVGANADATRAATDARREATDKATARDPILRVTNLASILGTTGTRIAADREELAIAQSNIARIEALPAASRSPVQTRELEASKSLLAPLTASIQQLETVAQEAIALMRNNGAAAIETDPPGGPPVPTRSTGDSPPDFPRTPGRRDPRTVPVDVETEAGAQLLPPGTPFRLPDGRTGTVQRR